MGAFVESAFVNVAIHEIFQLGTAFLASIAGGTFYTSGSKLSAPSARNGALAERTILFHDAIDRTSVGVANGCLQFAESTARPSTTPFKLFDGPLRSVFAHWRVGRSSTGLGALGNLLPTVHLAMQYVGNTRFAPSCFVLGPVIPKGIDAHACFAQVLRLV